MPTAFSHPRLHALLLTGVSVLTGCVPTMQVYQSPAIELPAPASATPEAPPAPKPPTVNAEWWKAFGDPVLNLLVQEALANNFDLARAAANIAEARANAGAVESLMSPRVDAMAKIGATQRELTFASNATDINSTIGTARAGVGVSWEIDLWGRIRQLDQAALAQVGASEHTRNATALSISSAVVDTYVQRYILETKLRITRGAARDLKDAADLEFRRWQAGAGTELRYRQSVAEWTATEARIPGIEAAVARTDLALRLILGRNPRQMSEAIPQGGEIRLPDIPREFDSDLLLRRPDVASAEQLLVAAHADANAIRTERYPRLNLSLLAGLVATTSKLISGVPMFWDASAGLAAPIFDGGLIQSKTEGAEARRDRAEAHYRYTVSVAFRETYEAMMLRETSDRQYEKAEVEVSTRKQSMALTQRSFDAGRSTKFEVLAESIKVLNAELAMADARQNQLAARSQYFKALGGGL